jgi:hypothetical protein
MASVQDHFDYPLIVGDKHIRVREIIETLDCLAHGIRLRYRDHGDILVDPAKKARFFRDFKLYRELADSRRRIEETVQSIAVQNPPAPQAVSGVDAVKN